jgi:hypothetical protein
LKEGESVAEDLPHDRGGDDAAVWLETVGAPRLVGHHEDQELRIVGGSDADKGGDVATRPLRVLLTRAGLAGEAQPAHARPTAGALLDDAHHGAPDEAQRRLVEGNPPHGRRRAVQQPRAAQVSAVEQRRVGDRELERSHRQLVAHADGDERVVPVPLLARRDLAGLLALDLDPGAPPEAEQVQIAIGLVDAERLAHLGDADVARLDEDHLEGQVSVRPDVAKPAAAEESRATPAVEDLLLLHGAPGERPRADEGLERRTGLVGALRGRDPQALRAHVGKSLRVEPRPRRHGQDLAGARIEGDRA